jgi:Lon protease-like protein
MTQTEQVTINFNRPLPLFPLPNAVLLPHSVLPLHVFEPRYRQMTREALDGPGLIAMAMFDGEVGQDAYYHGQPPLKPTVCVGYIERYEPLQDGRYLLLLRGLCRARIIEEKPSTEPYRAAMLEPIEWPPMPDEQLADERERIRERLEDPALASVDGVDELRELTGHEVPTVGLIDLAIATICDDPDQRYRMLQETDPAERAAWLVRKLDQLKMHAGHNEPPEFPDAPDAPDW